VRSLVGAVGAVVVVIGAAGARVQGGVACAIFLAVDILACGVHAL